MGRTRRARFGVALAAGALALTAAVPVWAQDASSITKMGIIAPDVRTNLGWDQQGVDGAQVAADSVGAELIVADGVGYVDYEPIMRQLADDGAQFIITQASGYATTAAQFATDTGIPVIVFDAPEATTPGLVADVLTNAQEGAYLAGVLAATMSQTGTLGMVISADTPSWHKANGGFVAGAKATNPDIKFVPVAQIGPDAYGDAEGGRRTTEAVIAAGADIVFGQGDGASFGMLQAVETATPPEGADKVWFIDVIGDKTSIDEQGVLLSSVLWDFSGTYTQAVADIGAGTFGQAGYVQDVNNGGISLLQTDHITPEAWTAVETAAAGITDGSIAVPTTNSAAEVDALIAGE